MTQVADGEGAGTVEVEPVDVDAARTPDFAEGFAPVGFAAWQRLVAKVVNRGKPEDRHLDPDAAVASLRTRTVDGLTIEPLYGLESPVQPLGRPGVMPFTRGRTPLRDGSAWDVRQWHDDPDAQSSHDAVMTDLERGVTSLWLTVGADGIDVADLAVVLADVDLELAPVIVGTWDDQDRGANAFADLLTSRGVGRTVSGSFGLDPLGRAAVRGGTPDFAPLRRWAARCGRDFPLVRAAVVDSRPYHDAGAGDVEELGCAIATGVAYVREMVSEGLSAATAFAHIEFRVVVSDDQFLSIAKLRALRRLWARVAQVCGVPEDQRGARTHAVTSWRMTSRDDPYVNMLRATIACFGACVGGAEAVTVLPFDTALGLPDPFSRRVARNTQILLAEEASLARVIDPGGGSWYVESLTEDLAGPAWAWFQTLESEGGMPGALRDGLVHDRLAQVRQRADTRLATREQPLTGVSTFPNLAETRVPRRARATLAPIDGAVAPLVRRRDAQVYEDLRDRASSATGGEGTPTVQLACLGARRDYGARETFTSSFLAAGGIACELIEFDTAPQTRWGRVAVLCSSPAVNAERGSAAVRSLRAAGVETVYLAGRETEIDEPELIDGTIAATVDAVAVLGDLLDRLTDSPHDVQQRTEARQA